MVRYEILISFFLAERRNWWVVIGWAVGGALLVGLGYTYVWASLFGDTETRARDVSRGTTCGLDSSNKCVRGC